MDNSYLQFILLEKLSLLQHKQLQCITKYQIHFSVFLTLIKSKHMRMSHKILEQTKVRNIKTA
jgi:hypothetical protein